MLSRLATSSIVNTSRTARTLHTTARAAMPLFICYCPDYPNNLETRLANRPDHLAASAKDKEAGNSGECGTSEGGREGEGWAEA